MNPIPKQRHPQGPTTGVCIKIGTNTPTTTTTTFKNEKMPILTSLLKRLLIRVHSVVLCLSGIDIQHTQYITEPHPIGGAIMIVF